MVLHIPTRYLVGEFRVPEPPACFSPAGKASRIKTEDAMKTIAIQVELAAEATREFEDIRDNPHRYVSEGGKRYLRQLLRYPVKQWQVIQRRCHHSAFRSKCHVPFDIQGKVYEDGTGLVKTVLITRFKLKDQAVFDRPEKGFGGRLSFGNPRFN